MNDDTNLYILAKLNAALSNDLDQVTNLTDQLGDLIKKAQNIPGINSDSLNKEWASLGAEFSGLAYFSQKIKTAYSEGKCAKDGECHTYWETIKTHQQKLEEAFDSILEKSPSLVEESYNEAWKDIWKTIYLKLNLVQAQASLAQAQMEMRSKYGKHDVTDKLAKEILKELPEEATLSSARQFSNEYRRSFSEMLDNKDKFGGFFDIFKSLLMSQDAPPEVVAKEKLNRLSR